MVRPSALSTVGRHLILLGLLQFTDVPFCNVSMFVEMCRSSGKVSAFFILFIWAAELLVKRKQSQLKSVFDLHAWNKVWDVVAIKGVTILLSLLLQKRSMWILANYFKSGSFELGHDYLKDDGPSFGYPSTRRGKRETRKWTWNFHMLPLQVISYPTYPVLILCCWDRKTEYKYRNRYFPIQSAIASVKASPHCLYFEDFELWELVRRNEVIKY